MTVRAPSTHRLRRFVATAAALGSLFAGLTACDPEVPSLPPLAWQGPELSAGNTGDEVTQMQVQLRTRGFWLNDAYGTFGETTRHTLVAFQKYFGLPRTGRLDERSRFILAAQSAKVEPRKPGAGRRVEVDIARQVLLISQDGVTVWVHDVSTGKSSTPTPRLVQDPASDQRQAHLGARPALAAEVLHRGLRPPRFAQRPELPGEPWLCPVDQRVDQHDLGRGPGPDRHAGRALLGSLMAPARRAHANVSCRPSRAPVNSGGTTAFNP